MILGGFAAAGVDGAEDLASAAAAAVRDIGNPIDQVRASAELASVVPDLVKVAMTAAEELQPPWDQAMVLVDLARAVPANHVVDRAWHALFSADIDPYWQARAMTDLVPLLAPDQLDSALVVALANPDPAGRAQALVLVAPLVRKGDGWFDAKSGEAGSPDGAGPRSRDAG